MKTIYEKHSGSLVIEEPYEVFGMVTGDVRVKAGGLLILNGMCTKSVTVEEGGEARIYGMVNGDLINDGGSVSVLGMIHGGLFEHGGITTVSSGAKVAKRGSRIVGGEIPSADGKISDPENGGDEHRVPSAG